MKERNKKVADLIIEWEEKMRKHYEKGMEVEYMQMLDSYNLSVEDMLEIDEYLMSHVFH